ncbi:MAG: S41 family peptidase [Planctomycetota bacterium]|nr:S41 family peptidase [Planctomycetota bacterium]
MPKRNLAWILVIMMIAGLMWQLPQTIARRDSVAQAFGPLVDARALIHKRFVRSVDDGELVSSTVEGGIDAMIKSLGDPYALYLTEKEYDRFQDRTEGIYGGIGLDVLAVEGGLEVLSRAPNSPAAFADIAAGDIITKIDGRSIAGVPLVEAVDSYLNGPPGSVVLLDVVTPGQSESRRVQIRRARIELDPIRGVSRTEGDAWRYMLDEEARIGYVQLAKFTPIAQDRMDAAVSVLFQQDMRAMILDLRENTGGLLDQAVAVADRFLTAGTIVRIQGEKTDDKKYAASKDGTYRPFPLVVLINGSTASAAEIVAGALRDHHRGYVIGERSYGKGSVQELLHLAPGGGAIKITTAFYFLPSGECIQRTPASVERGNWGVTPDEHIVMTAEQKQRWLTVWREIRRAPADDATSRPVSETSLATAHPEYHRRAAQRLLDVDIQLVAALNYLLPRVSRPGQRTPRSQTPVSKSAF